MPKKLSDLRNILRKKYERIEKEANQRVQNTVIEMVRELVAHTPVDTSQAISNWIVEPGTVDYSFIGPWVPGRRGSTKARSGTIALRYARIQAKSKKPGQPLFISNSAPYIRDLDAGTISRQPGGFVARARIVGITTLKKKAKRNG